MADHLNKDTAEQRARKKWAQALLQAPSEATSTVALQVKHFPEKQWVYGRKPTLCPESMSAGEGISFALGCLCSGLRSMGEPAVRLTVAKRSLRQRMIALIAAYALALANMF